MQSCLPSHWEAHPDNLRNLLLKRFSDFTKQFAFSSKDLEEALAAGPEANYPKRRGIDFYHHYKEDIKMFAEMGYKIFRMSISWFAAVAPPQRKFSGNFSGDVLLYIIVPPI